MDERTALTFARRLMGDILRCLQPMLCLAKIKNTLFPEHICGSHALKLRVKMCIRPGSRVPDQSFP